MIGLAIVLGLFSCLVVGNVCIKDRVVHREKYRRQRMWELSRVHRGKPVPCAVCLDDVVAQQESMQLPCKHVYHRACISRWITVKNDCPTCRGVVFGHEPVKPVPVPVALAPTAAEPTYL